MSQKIAYNQPSLSPTPKVASAGVGGAVSAILLFIATSVWPDVHISAEVGAAIATLISFLSAYMTRDRKPVEAVEEILESKPSDHIEG